MKRFLPVLVGVMLTGCGNPIDRAERQGDVSALIHALNKPDAKTREAAADALGRLGLKARPAIPDLIKATEDTEFRVGLAAAYALAAVGPASTAPLLEALKEGSDDARGHAAQALGLLGEGAKVATPQLIALLGYKDRTNYLRRSAVIALSQLGPIVLPPLIKALEDPDVEKRCEAAYTLGIIGGTAGTAVPALRRILDSDEARVRQTGVVALGSIGPKAKEAVPNLLAALVDSDEQVRASAADSLAKIQAKPGEVVPALAKALKDDSPLVRQRAMRALRRYGPAARQVLPAIQSAQNDSDWKTSMNATRALYHLANPGKPSRD